MIYEHICKLCKTVFTNGRKKSVFCSPKCQWKAKEKHPEPRLCSCGCGTVIERRYYDKNRPNSYVHNHHTKGKNNPKWNDAGRFKDTINGYIFIRKPDHPNAKINRGQFIAEHVFVMSEHIGRPLVPGEIVHHKNGIRDDNRIENLVIMTNSQHISHHHKGLIKPNSIKNLENYHREQGHIMGPK